MMTCSQVRPIISFVIEKETSPRETLEARRHIDGCRSCNDRERDLRHVMSSVGTMPQPASAGATAPLVMERLRSMRERLSVQGATQLAAKWSGLCLILAACLIATSSSYRQSLSSGLEVFPPIANMMNSEMVVDATEAIVAYAAPIAIGGAGGTLGSNVDFEPASDLSIMMSILATALVLLLSLAIPVSVTAAWIVRRSGHRDSLL